MRVRHFLHIHFLILLVVAVAGIWYAVLAEERAGLLTVAFLDVGQGDAIFVQSPTGRQLLIDGGPDQSVLRELGRIMPFYDHTIDVMIATHPDKDHIAGLPAVLERYEVDFILEPGVRSNTSFDEAFARGSDEELGAEHIYARRGQSIDLGGGAILTILFPDRSVSGLETNTASVVAKLTYGDTSFLFTGDSPQGIEDYLILLDGTMLDVDVLKAGHHGSKTSTSEAFVGIASPLYAVISAGEENRYGHPHQEVLDIFKKFDVPIVGTYERGMIIFSSDGREIHMRD